MILFHVETADICALLDGKTVRQQHLKSAGEPLLKYRKQQALQAEVLGSGIIVQALCPGFTITEFHDTEMMTEFNREKVPQVLWMTATEVVNTSLHSLDPNHVICIPGRRYQRWWRAQKAALPH